ncbi:hypothetical protein PCANC_07959 [Puccinia coronata f. sp. avenae]|uniref:Uncharacterized protein n=1 Tax=Puccinia coronata f. sp. avenae TaxID=200324 RepID=A0A2N5SHI7_9BASI|nr:hypothetical protein PCANC_14418 [Puccinia coronata f. sp. avenae]PLW42816.1 hypothetical protein PCANC_07959 [Puccinia coronata f. sp. avenae]
MLGLLLLATKLMSFRTPGAATLVALVSLSETVMTAPALCFNRETTFENGTRVTNLYFFRRDPHTMDTTVVMQPGAGTGIFSSGERQKEVYMGNVQQTFLSHENLVFKSLLPGLQTYRFSPSGVDFLVVHDGRTLLNLSRMIGNQGQFANRIPEAGEHVHPSDLVPQWHAFIPRGGQVEEVQIEITHVNNDLENMVFEVNVAKTLHKASSWKSFRLIGYKLKLKKQSSKRETDPTTTTNQ